MIPGIGTKIAATILAEIGEIDRFDHKKLVAFAGIDPSVFSSGKFTATRNKITKRGSICPKRPSSPLQIKKVEQEKQLLPTI
ncbi:transposase [Bacillus sp. FJAT-26390]|uniref:transposase n=1 Tax=Bacillus sp. FJAT-26390 TaxID=1743142 RepID=UPI0021000297|nr:transposase [Bacillus sp. FJAT-26390]